MIPVPPPTGGDDTSMIQALINATPLGDTIVLQPAPYKINPTKGLRIPRAMTLDARGATPTSLPHTGPKNRLIETIPGVSDFTLLGGRWIGAPPIPGIEFSILWRIDSGSNITGIGCEFVGAYTDGIWVGGNLGSHNVRLDQIVTENCRRNGLGVVKGSDIFVERSAFRGSWGNPGAGIDIEPNFGDQIIDVTVIDCSFEENINGLYAHKGKGLGGANYKFIDLTIFPRADGTSVTGFIANSVDGLTVSRVSVGPGSTRAFNVGTAKNATVTQCFADGKQFDFLFDKATSLFGQGLLGDVTSNTVPGGEVLIWP